MKYSKKTWALGILMVLVMLLAACGAGPNPYLNTNKVGFTSPAGFWMGLWHGIIAGFAFIASLFWDGIGIYEVNNNGGWYNFGYLLGLGTFGSGIRISLKR